MTFSVPQISDTMKTFAAISLKSFAIRLHVIADSIENSQDPYQTALLSQSDLCLLYEPHYEKTGFLHMQKQRRRSAAQ